jgi:hypothetical protein
VRIAPSRASPGLSDMNARHAAWGKCNAGPASLQAAMSVKLRQVFNIRTKFARIFG